MSLGRCITVNKANEKFKNDLNVVIMFTVYIDND